MLLSETKTAAEKTPFARCYYDNRRALLRYARRLLKNRREAEDVVHDVFRVVIENDMRILYERDAVGVRRFLFICTRNRAFNILKRRKRRVPLESVDESLLHTSGVLYQEDIADMLIENEFKQKGIEAIGGLPPIYADVLWLYLDGLSVKQIASCLDIKENTASQRLLRAKKKLREAVGAEGDDD